MPLFPSAYLNDNYNKTSQGYNETNMIKLVQLT